VRIIVHNCRTQYSTEQFWLLSSPNLQTVIKAQMLSFGGGRNSQWSYFIFIITPYGSIEYKYTLSNHNH